MALSEQVLATIKSLASENILPRLNKLAVKAHDAIPAGNSALLEAAEGLGTGPLYRLNTLHDAAKPAVDVLRYLHIEQVPPPTTVQRLEEAVRRIKVKTTEGMIGAVDETRQLVIRYDTAMLERIRQTHGRLPDIERNAYSELEKLKVEFERPDALPDVVTIANKHGPNTISEAVKGMEDILSEAQKKLTTPMVGQFTSKIGPG